MIEFENVRKTYADGTVAIEDLTLSIETGEFMVLVGPSGCGKTTMLRLINRMEETTEGQVRVEGKDVMSLDPIALRRSIGYVIQGGGLLPHRTVVDNIATTPLLNGMPRRQARARALGLMPIVGLDQSLAGRYPSQLSGGQAQRVGVARALAAGAHTLLMDEPFSAIDPVVRRDLQREIKRIQRDTGATVVFVTHDINEALLLADRLAVIGPHGRIEQLDTPDRMLSAPANAWVRDFIEAGRPQIHTGTETGE